MLYENESELTKYLPNGYYVLSMEDGSEACLVYLYEHEDFNGVRHIAYGAQDGGEFCGVNEFVSGLKFTPVTISKSVDQYWFQPSDRTTIEHIAAIG